MQICARWFWQWCSQRVNLEIYIYRLRVNLYLFREENEKEDGV